MQWFENRVLFFVFGCQVCTSRSALQKVESFQLLAKSMGTNLSICKLLRNAKISFWQSEVFHIGHPTYFTLVCVSAPCLLNGDNALSFTWVLQWWMVCKALRFWGDEHHRKAQEEINNFVFRAGLEQWFLNKAEGNILNNEAKKKILNSC